MSEDSQKPLSTMLRSPIWKVRKEGYERLLFFLQSGQREGCINGETVTLDKALPLLNMLGEEQNAMVTLQGMECLKISLQQPGFKVSSVNHMLSEGLEKYGSSGRLAVEFEALVSALMVKWCGYLVSLICSKLDSKNVKTQLFCLQILQSPCTFERILRSREISHQLATSLTTLCNSQSKEVKGIATELRAAIGSTQKSGAERPHSAKKQPLEGLYSQLVRTYDQLENNRKIESAKELRQSVESLLEQGRLWVDPQNDHYGLFYTLRLMIDDSNQLLWAEGAKLLTLLIPSGLIPKETGFCVEKLRLGKVPSNQLIYNLFDQYLLHASPKKTDDYLLMLKQLSEASNKENVKVGTFQLVARLAFIVNLIDANEATCESIQNGIFWGQPMPTQAVEQSQSPEQIKRRLINSYNKISLGWLVQNRASSKYREIIEQVLLAMKHYNDKSFAVEKSPKAQPKSAEAPSKKEGLAKLFSEMVAASHTLKELDKKIVAVRDYLKANQSKYKIPFYELDLISELARKLQHTSINAACADRLSEFVLEQLGGIFSRYPAADRDCYQLFVELVFCGLSFGRREQLLTTLLDAVSGRVGVFESLLRNIGKLDSIKQSSLRIVQRWLLAREDFEQEGWYDRLLDAISEDLLKRKKKVPSPDVSSSIPSYNNVEKVQKVLRQQVSAKKEFDFPAVDSLEDVLPGFVETVRPKSILPKEPVLDRSESSIAEPTSQQQFDSVQFLEKEPESGDFEELGARQSLLPLEELRERLAQERNCFFFLKNEVYSQFTRLPTVEEKQSLLRDLEQVVSTFKLSDVCYDNLLNVLFLLFAEVPLSLMQGRKECRLSDQLQHIYEQLRKRRDLPKFFKQLLRNIKPILESINNTQGNFTSNADSEFVASILAKSLQLLGAHLPHEQHLQLLCHINQYFQLGEVVYFELYKNEYEIINRSLFSMCGPWLVQMQPEEAAATMDTFDSLCDNAFKRFVESQLQ